MKVANSLEHNVGELNTSDAKHAFFDPNSRRLIKVTPEGAEEALKILSSTSARRELMESNKLLTNPYKLK
jgi:DNA gyrase/topoisomerase IV subunit B